MAGIWYCKPLLICSWLLYQNQRAAALAWMIGLALVLTLNPLLKHLYALPRPDLLLEPLTSFSYPSGHSSGGALFFALLAAFIAQQLSYHRRWLIYVLAALPMLAIGASRLYLGVHWFSDVIGGGLLGLALASAVRTGYSRYDRQPITWSSAALWLGSLLLAAGYISFNLSSAEALYQLR